MKKNVLQHFFLSQDLNGVHGNHKLMPLTTISGKREESIIKKSSRVSMDFAEDSTVSLTSHHFMSM